VIGSFHEQPGAGELVLEERARSLLIFSRDLYAG